MEQFILENGIFIIKRLAKTEYSRNDNALKRSVILIRTMILKLQNYCIRLIKLMKILITGGCVFIGSNLTELLVKGYDVTT